MIKEIELSVKPSEAASATALKKVVGSHIGLPADAISCCHILRRSVDARHRPVWIRLQIRVYTHSDRHQPWKSPFIFKEVSGNARVIIAGTGPAGMFAALELLQKGMKPLLLERGRDMGERKRDIARLNREHKVNPDSNYCFGEGGAGTFSDGKLYTRSTKRGNVQRVLEMMVHHGASPDILVDAHPHIGSDKLFPLITSIRQTILDHGGEILFGHRVTDIIHHDGRVTGFKDQFGNLFAGEEYILATGHSAREIYHLFHHNGWPLLFKPFALGVRVEHPQELISSIQYHAKRPDPLLPAATYSLTAQSGGYGVFSFCMCPGGTIVPSATGQDHVVVNGMSNSRRNSPWANAGIVTEVREVDVAMYGQHGPLAGLLYQEAVERQMRIGGEYSQKAPAQRLNDFLENRYPTDLPVSSYKPGLQPASLHELLPNGIVERLQDGFRQFDRKMVGFITREAIVVGGESRTSSPVRIPRDTANLAYPLFPNLYPCGEGSGYAGGIISSAIDGQNAAHAILAKKGVI